MLFMITDSWLNTAPRRVVRALRAGIASGAKPKNGAMRDEYDTLLSSTVCRRWLVLTPLTFNANRPLPPGRITLLWAGTLGALGSWKSRDLSSGTPGPAFIFRAIFCSLVAGSMTGLPFRSVTLVAV